MISGPTSNNRRLATVATVQRRPATLNLRFLTGPNQAKICLERIQGTKKQANDLFQSAAHLKLLLNYGRRYEDVNAAISFDEIRSEIKELESEYEKLTGEPMGASMEKEAVNHDRAGIRALGYSCFLLQQASVKGDKGMKQQHEDLKKLHESAYGTKVENDGFDPSANQCKTS